jgi:hypothetical protein
MANPQSRRELREHCLRTLGKPVIDINVDEDQLEDRIDDALQYFAEYHFDGVERVYDKHQITAADITNQYISVPDPVVSVTRVLPISDASTISMFDVRYQLRLNEFYDFSSVSVQYYDTVMKHMRMLDMLFAGEHPIEFNRKQNRLYINGFEWGTELKEDKYLIIESYRRLDANTYTEIYNDMFLKEYTTALFKLQWGTNLSKFDGIQLPGGATLNGRQIVEDAKEEIQRIKEQMSLNYELPVDFMVG